MRLATRSIIGVAMIAALACASRATTPAGARRIGAAVNVAPSSATTAAAAAATGDSVGDLPLTVVAPAGQPAPELAVLLTGDGGWARIDREISDSLSKHGIPVVALDSRAYLEDKRSPEDASRDLARIMTHFMAALGKARVVLIGYSRGADVLPFMASRLPAQLLASVQLIALLGPAPNANLKFHLIDLVSNHHREDDLPTIPEIAKLRGHHLVCFYGAEEEETACGSIESSTAVSYEMPGGHHFDQKYGAIASRILAQLSTPES